MATEWYYRIGGRDVGPIPPSTLKQLAADGVVYSETPVRRGQDASWTTAKHVRGLFPEATPKATDSTESAPGEREDEGKLAHCEAQPRPRGTPGTSTPGNILSTEAGTAVGCLTVAIIAILVCLLIYSTSASRSVMESFLLVVMVAGLAIGIFYIFFFANMSTEERTAFFCEQKLGHPNDVMICPHCQTKGKVRTKMITQKVGVSGAKATGAILTGGVSLLATGLSQKENKTQAHCDNCGATWTF